jgi:hypothetical protein
MKAVYENKLYNLESLCIHNLAQKCLRKSSFFRRPTKIYISSDSWPITKHGHLGNMLRTNNFNNRHPQENWKDYRLKLNMNFRSISISHNEEPVRKLMQKVAPTHKSVKNNECDVTYILKEPRRRSKCVIHKAWRFPLLCRRYYRVVYQRRVPD